MTIKIPETRITDFDMKEDLEEAVENNPDVVFENEELSEKFNKVEFGTLLEVTKKITNKLVITGFKPVTEELLEGAFTKDDKKHSAKVYHAMRSILPDNYDEREKDEKVIRLAKGVNKSRLRERERETSEGYVEKLIKEVISILCDDVVKSVKNQTTEKYERKLISLLQEIKKLRRENDE